MNQADVLGLATGKPTRSHGTGLQGLQGVGLQPENLADRLLAQQLVNRLLRNGCCNVQGCQHPYNKGQGLLGFWICCSMPHSRMMQHSTDF
eukprot:1160487-Pelagomonas_calceolata.AAC.5